MTIIYPPQNYVPENDFGDTYWMQRLMTPIWRRCHKGDHPRPTPFHVEVEGMVGSLQPIEALWACSTCGYRYAPSMEPEAMSPEWHAEHLAAALATEALGEVVTSSHPMMPPNVADRSSSASAVAVWRRNVDDQEESLSDTTDDE